MTSSMSAKGGSAFGGKRQSVTSSLLWLFIAEIVFNFSGYIIHAFLARFFGPSDYGRYSLVITLATMIIMLIGNGIPTAMSKYISGIFETKPGLVLIIKRQAAIIQILFIGVATLIFYALAPLIAWLLNDLSLIPLLRLSAFILPTFAAASFYLYFYVGIHRFRLQSILKLVRSAARIILVILLAYFFHLKGSVAGYIFAPATVFLTAWIIDRFWINRNFPKKTSETFDWKKLLRYAWPVTLFMIFYEIMNTIDIYMVKSILKSDYLTGIYNSALTAGRIPFYLFQALTLAMLPSISRVTEKNDYKEANRIISQTFRLLVMFLLPIAIIFLVYSAPIIQFFFGSSFLEGNTPLKIIAAETGFLTIFYIMSFALNGAGKVKIPMYVALAGMLLNAILNYLLVPPYAILGSAIATAINSVFIALISLFFAQKYFGVFIKIKALLRIALAGAVMYFCSYFFPPQKWIFILWGIILSGVYILVLYILREFTKDDVETFKKILLSGKNKEDIYIQNK